MLLSGTSSADRTACCLGRGGRGVSPRRGRRLRWVLSPLFHFHDKSAESTWRNCSRALGFVMVLDYRRGRRQLGARSPMRQSEATIETEGSLLRCRPQSTSRFPLFFPSVDLATAVAWMEVTAALGVKLLQTICPLLR